MSVGIVIAGGGTAGHVYPGIALARALSERRPDANICFVGTARGIENAAVPAAGYRLRLIQVTPWSSSLGARRYAAPASLVRATGQAHRILASEGADIVVGMGGYASMPVVLAGRARRLPVLLHEQNGVPGIANVVGSRVTRNIALVFEEARRSFPRSADIRVTGNPIRAAIAGLDRAAVRDEARDALGLEREPATVVFFGGSLGATRLNEAAIGLAAEWKRGSGRQGLLITGSAHAADIAARIPADSALRTVGYLDRMEHVYAAADLVVCRAGATTVAELGATGAPSVLVPYPHARRDHQTVNARALERTGGAVVVADADATPERLGALVEELLSDAPRLARMSAGARRFGKPGAAAELASWVIELAGGRDA